MEGPKKQRIQEDIYSPSHEFSFAVSLESSSTRNPESQQPPLAIDLTPADDIFFHGHLLPLHLLSNLPVSARSSTNSMDDFTLPVRHNNRMDSCIGSECDGSTRGQSFNSYEYNNRKERAKSKSFSLLRLGTRRKEAEEGGEGEGEKHKKKLRFDVAHFLKRYIRMFSKERRDEDIQFRKQPYSFSGKLSPREARDLRGRRGEMSAPASIRTSPGNSGVLRPPLHHSKDSSMEELQAAIQSAIAHCKNSISAADNKHIS